MDFKPMRAGRHGERYRTRRRRGHEQTGVALLLAIEQHILHHQWRGFEIEAHALGIHGDHAAEGSKPQFAVRIFCCGRLVAERAFFGGQPIAAIEYLHIYAGLFAAADSVQFGVLDTQDSTIGAKPEIAEIVRENGANAAGGQPLFLGNAGEQPLPQANDAIVFGADPQSVIAVRKQRGDAFISQRRRFGNLQKLIIIEPVESTGLIASPYFSTLWIFRKAADAAVRWGIAQWIFFKVIVAYERNRHVVGADPDAPLRVFKEAVDRRTGALSAKDLTAG